MSYSSLIHGCGLSIALLFWYLVIGAYNVSNVNGEWLARSLSTPSGESYIAATWTGDGTVLVAGAGTSSVITRSTDYGVTWLVYPLQFYILGCLTLFLKKLFLAIGPLFCRNRHSFSME